MHTTRRGCLMESRRDTQGGIDTHLVDSHTTCDNARHQTRDFHLHSIFPDTCFPDSQDCLLCLTAIGHRHLTMGPHHIVPYQYPALNQFFNNLIKGRFGEILLRWVVGNYLSLSL